MNGRGDARGYDGGEQDEREDGERAEEHRQAAALATFVGENIRQCTRAAMRARSLA